MRSKNIMDDEEGSSPLVVTVPGVNANSCDKGTNETSVSARRRRFLADHGYIFVTVTQVVGLCVVAFIVGACIPIAMKLNRVRTTGSAASSGSNTPTITIQTPTDQLFNNLRHPPSLLKTDKSRTNANSNLKIAWLMSFPNSGASYTLNLVSAASNTRVATNYCWESPEEGHNGNWSTLTEQNNVPIFPLITTNSATTTTADSNSSTSIAAGPFWWYPDSVTEPQQRQSPTRTVLTKTYCGGYCHDCNALASAETPHSFMMHCAMADVDVLGVAGSDEHDVGEHVRERYVYEYNTIDRAVHLIRNPLDNIVSRYHSEIARILAATTENTGENNTDMEWIQRYTYDSAGFQAYCADVTNSRDERKDSHVDQQVLRLIDDIPCHMDIFRYVQWHNLAFITTNNYLTLPSHVLHYEDYHSNLEETLKPLLEFLELPDTRNGASVPIALTAFPSEPSFLEYYTTDQRDRIQTAIMMLASPLTWQHLERYFEKTN